MSRYTTKVTRIGMYWFCAVHKDGQRILSAKVTSREHIGGAFRDLLRTIDKCGTGDSFTNAVRHRGNNIAVKHIWELQ